MASESDFFGFIWLLVLNQVLHLTCALRECAYKQEGLQGNFYYCLDKYHCCSNDECCKTIQTVPFSSQWYFWVGVAALSLCVLMIVVIGCKRQYIRRKPIRVRIGPMVSPESNNSTRRGDVSRTDQRLAMGVVPGYTNPVAPVAPPAYSLYPDSQPDAPPPPYTQVLPPMTSDGYNHHGNVHSHSHAPPPPPQYGNPNQQTSYF